MSRYRGYVTVNIDQNIDIDIDTIMEELSDEDLMVEVQRRNLLPPSAEPIRFKTLDKQMILDEIAPLFSQLSLEQWQDMIQLYKENRYPKLRTA